MSGLFFVQLIPVLFTGFLAFLVYTLGTAVKFSGIDALGGLSWMLPNTPALNEFLAFVLQAVIAVAALVCTLLQVSNHIILSLDILYLFSLSMLVMYHTIKQSGCLLRIIHA